MAVSGGAHFLIYIQEYFSCFFIFRHKSHNERNLMDLVVKTIHQKQHSLKKTKLNLSQERCLLNIM